MGRSPIAGRVPGWLIGITLAVAVFGCGPALPSGSPSRDFTQYLAGYGQVLTPAIAPPGVADWRDAVNGFPLPGAVVESAIFGVVTCVDPSLNCARRGLVRPGESLPIWIVTFADSPAADGCPMWATVDARTGSFINGTGPPCS
jgi:hypothetical protein